MGLTKKEFTDGLVHFCKCIDFDLSQLDAAAVRFMNEIPGKVAEVIDAVKSQEIESEKSADQEPEPVVEDQEPEPVVEDQDQEPEPTEKELDKMADDYHQGQGPEKTKTDRGSGVS